MRVRKILFCSFLFVLLIIPTREDRDNFKTIDDFRKFDFSEKKRVVKIGIIDGKINRNIESFPDVLSLKTMDFVSNFKHVDIEHATTVFGVIATNKMKSAGIVDSKYLEIYNASILSDGTCSISNFERAIEWTIKQNVEVINISIYFNEFSENIINFIQKEKDTLFIFSNGNFDIRERKEYLFDNLIFIGATDKKGRKSKINAKTEADVYFQGEDILTTAVDGAHAEVKGTTYSTAIATGVVVKKLQSTKDRDELTVKELKNYLISSGNVYK